MVVVLPPFFPVCIGVDDGVVIAVIPVLLAAFPVCVLVVVVVVVREVLEFLGTHLPSVSLSLKPSGHDDVFCVFDGGVGGAGQLPLASGDEPSEQGVCEVEEDEDDGAVLLELLLPPLPLPLPLLLLPPPPLLSFDEDEDDDEPCFFANTSA